MPPAAGGNDLSGITLDGRYTLIRRLGEGAMGQVYDAHHAALDRRVAVKVLHRWLAEEGRYRQRFVREARAASRIKHPSVVEILDFGTTPNDSVYLVMEFLEGRDLKAVLKAEGPLPWPRARHFLLQAVSALAEAHRQEVIHRDVKPANCFVCDSEEPALPERMKLLDFGIAKLDEDPGVSDFGRKRITQTGELVGTLAYMAPEFAEGLPASMSSDMYSLGIMAYELLTGEVPFRGRNEFQVLARHLSEPPVRPRVKVPTIPAAVETMVLRLLAKKPADRYESMAEVERLMLAIPGDLTGDEPMVVPRREGSGPRSAARREGSGPRGAARREGSGPKPPVRWREGSGPRTAARRSSSEIVVSAAEPAERRSAAAAGDEETIAGDARASGDHHRETLVAPVGARAEAGTDGRWSEIRDVGDFGGDEDHDLRPPSRMEWGTVATIVLLVLLSVAAVVSVVLRQQELSKAPVPAPVPAEPSVSPAPSEPSPVPSEPSR